MPKLTVEDYRNRNMGKDTLNITHPTLVPSWHKNKNGNLLPSDVIATDYVKVWWHCPICTNEWQETVHRRAVDGRGCAGCAGQKTIPGFNDIATTEPQFLKEWDYRLNNKAGIYPTQISRKSHTKIHWKCPLGHRWLADMNNRSKGQGCPYCMRQKVLEGFNDLATTHPDIAKQWHPTKNGDLKPTQILAGSGRKIWWHCPNCDQDFESKLSHRTNKKMATGCPVCTGRKVVPGYNDLATTHPRIANEWHPTKNGKLKPTDLVAGSFVKVWWRCKNGHEWMANPSHRCPTNGTNCPICANLSRSSYPEQKIFYYLQQHFEDAINCYRPSWMRYKELDIYIDSLKIGIEYDGEYFHQDVHKDSIKSSLCEDHGVTLIRIRETGCPPINDGSIQLFVNPHDENSLNQAISDLLIRLSSETSFIDFDEFTRDNWNEISDKYIDT